MELEVRAGADHLQSLVDESATFHLLIVPDSKRTASMPSAGGRAVGMDVTAWLRPMTLALDVPTAAGVTGTNVVGEPVGEVHLRWLVIDHDAAARPDGAPPVCALDRTRSQRFVIEEATFRFAGGDAFRSFGTGRTFPIATLPGGRPALTVGAVGNVTDGAGRFRNVVGNYTLAGEWTEDGAFSGHVMVRFLDPDGTLRSAEVAPRRESDAGEDGITYLTWIAQKGHGPDQENTFSVTPDGQARGLNIPVQLKRVWTDFAIDGGFHVSRLRTGEVMGREIGFGKEARERTPLMGTALTPFQFEGVSRYSFYDPAGHTIGTLTANVLEGRSIRVQFPTAPDAPALRFGYFGPLVTGSGCFSGVQGMLYGTAGSVFAPPPATHVISNLYVARLTDPSGRWRNPASRVPPRPRTPAASLRQPDPTFLPLVDRLDEFAPIHKTWRAGVTACADHFAHVIAKTYNHHRFMGEFPAWGMDEAELRAILQGGGVKPFDQETFNRYGGRAKGVFRTYTFAEHDEINAAPLYSYWDTQNFTRPDGRVYKQIVGSFQGYYLPDQLPPLSEGKVDLLANSWRADVGVVSWIDIHQNERHLRTSFAYKMPRPHEILWFVKDLWINGEEIRNNTFMVSHEWREEQNGRMHYLMVAMFFDVDFDRCTIKRHGDAFWRVRYEQE